MVQKISVRLSKIKSVHIFSSKRHLVFFLVNTARIERYLAISINATIDLINTLDQIWNDAPEGLAGLIDPI